MALELDSKAERILVSFAIERLAQMDRASASEAEGRAFESRIAQRVDLAPRLSADSCSSGVQIQPLAAVLGRLGLSRDWLSLWLLPLRRFGLGRGRDRGTGVTIDSSDFARAHFGLLPIK
jgi:hypothetical protein